MSDDSVHFYSVRLDENPITEFEKFDNKPFAGREKEIESLYNIVDEIRLRGCQKRYFRFEDAAHAIAVLSEDINEENKDFGIRLYCIRCTDELLILLNGDVKTTQKALECPNVRNHFRLANKIANKLDEALANGEISYQEDEPFENFELEI